jgi:Zn-finger nucleic acid-binding protein
MIVECPGCKRRYDVSGRPPGSRARCRCGSSFTLPEPKTDSAALKCPNCGANADSAATRCGYCEADLAVRACPRCFGKLFLGTRFCPQCGAKSDEPAQAMADGNASPRHCPRCRGGGKVQLESQLVSDVMLDACTDCRGVFLDSDLLERILAERRYKGVRGAPTGSTNAAAAAARPPQGPFYVKCPDCEKNMARRVFAPRAGVIVDVCQHHGTWLDPDELDQLVSFVQSGGLDQGRGGTSFESTVLRPPKPVATPAPKRRAPRDTSPLGRSSFFEGALEAIGTLFD